MIQKPIEQITKADIESLVSAKVSERRTLEYKQQMPGSLSDEKREFLYDVSSFADALGGDLIFGIADERDGDGKPTGLPASPSGVATSNVTAEISRLENLIRDGVDPRIQAIQWKSVEGFPTGPVVVMRIPKSLLGPHMVIFGGMARFYSRNSTGKYPMDVGEIRSAFGESMALSERLHAFTAERLGKIAKGVVPLLLGTDAKVVIHLVPLSSLGTTNSRDVTRDVARLESLLQPIKGTSRGGRFNFDGYLVVSKNGESYVQVFRSGIIEAGAKPFLAIPEQYKNHIPGIDFEKTIIEKLSLYLDVERRLATPLPIFAVVTLLNVNNYRMSSYNSEAHSHPIDRADLRLPEIMIEDFNLDVARLLRPTFDALWQASGLEKSLNYDDEGNWRPHHS
jgi:hypothetical protein